MRTYEQLTEAEQEEAKNIALVTLLEAILEGGLRFADMIRAGRDDKANENDLQARIDKAWAEADRMQTPWFAHEYILDTCREDLEGMASCDAEDALYPDRTEYIIRLKGA
jgi:hypothetical protein